MQLQESKILPQFSTESDKLSFFPFLSEKTELLSQDIYNLGDPSVDGKLAVGGLCDMGDASCNGHGRSMAAAADLHKVPLCVGCGEPIYDQFILRVAPNLEWHAGCLKCADCGQHLDETRTCFVRDGKTYCKQDYIMLYGRKCSKCGIGFTKNEFFMRARNKIFHTECFRCIACNRQLVPGDEFALAENGLFCKADHVGRSSMRNELDLQTGVEPLSGLSPMGIPIGGVMSPVLPGMGPAGHMGSGGSARNVSAPSAPSGRRSHKDPKTTRVRTVLNEKQLHILRTCYTANPRPDALMKEQLVEMTALSPRVIRVWFQNKRCKDKKRSIALKQMQEHSNGHQHQDGDQAMPNGGVHNLSGMHGVPMVASDPVRNDSDLNVKPVEVRNYQQPTWKALSTIALQSVIEQPFQQLVNNFCDPGQGSMSDSSEISSIPSVSSALTSCSTSMTSQDINVSVCS